jgi:hypothetical protein
MAQTAHPLDFHPLSFQQLSVMEVSFSLPQNLNPTNHASRRANMGFTFVARRAGR